MKTALITGISGQGGFHLAQLLLDKGYTIVGTTRDINQISSEKLKTLLQFDRVSLRALDLQNGGVVLDLIDQLRPDEIYHLAAPSSVARSFHEPAETIYCLTLTTVNVLEAVRKTDKTTPCFVATSTEMFGNCIDPATKLTLHNPKSPYGIGKSCAHYQTKNYREAYGLYASSGILSNFESSMRPKNYVTSKIVSAACQIALGQSSSIELGNLSVKRDWGSASDFMQAAMLSLQQSEPDDYLIATGVTHSLEEFLEIAFSALDLDYQDHLLIKESLLRPLDIRQTICDPSETHKKLGWSAETTLNNVISDMVYAELVSLVGQGEALKLLSRNNSNSNTL